MHPVIHNYQTLISLGGEAPMDALPALEYWSDVDIAVLFDILDPRIDPRHGKKKIN